MIYEAIRSSGIRVRCDPVAEQHLKKQLTIKFYDYITGESKLVACYRRKYPYIWIPRHYPLPINPTLYKYTYKSIDIASKITPRDEIQARAIPFLSQNMADCILQLPPGFGKTVITIAAIAKLKIKTLVIVDQRDLVEQWVDAINKFTNLQLKPDFKAEFEQPICVVTIQKLLAIMRKDPIELWTKITKAGFGTVVFDEVHVLLGPEQFTNVAFALPIRKYIAVSATPYRLDDSGRILKYWIGGNKFSNMKEFKVTVVVKCYDSGIPDKTWRFIAYGGNVSKTRYLKMLAKQDNFYTTVVEIITKLLEKKRKILVLFERTDMIDKVSNILTSKQIAHTKYYRDVGREALSSNLILATYTKCNKAIDIPHIDTLVYATPITNVITLEQTKGRIQRKFPDKQSPLIVDLVDIAGSGPYNVTYMLDKRMKFYETSNFTVIFKDCGVYTV